MELVTKTKAMGHSAQEARREAETKHDTTEMNPQDFGAAGPVVSFVSDFSSQTQPLPFPQEVAWYPCVIKGHFPWFYL